MLQFYWWGAEERQGVSGAVDPWSSLVSQPRQADEFQKINMERS